MAIAISHTGTTTDTVEALRVAEAGGATTIAITNVRDSPLTAHARLVLTTAARETTFRSGAMASRIAQLAVVDCLFVGVAQRSWDRTCGRSSAPSSPSRVGASSQGAAACGRGADRRRTTGNGHSRRLTTRPMDRCGDLGRRRRERGTRFSL